MNLINGCADQINLFKRFLIKDAAHKAQIVR